MNLGQTEMRIAFFGRCNIYNSSPTPHCAACDKADSQQINELAFHIANKTGLQRTSCKQFLTPSKITHNPLNYLPLCRHTGRLDSRTKHVAPNSSHGHALDLMRRVLALLLQPEDCAAKNCCSSAAMSGLFQPEYHCG